MKKRGLSLLLCFIMLISSVPMGPVSSFVTMASAVSIQSLKEFFYEIPVKEEWDNLYLDWSTLALWYDSAEKIIDRPSDYTQTQIDATEASLKNAYNNLQYHTQSIGLNKTVLNLAVGESYTLKAFLDPENAADKVTWSSSNSDFVDVSDSGVVTVKKYSAALVSVYATSNGKRASCAVKISNPLGFVTVSPSKKTVYDSKGFQLTVKYGGIDKSASCSENVSLSYASSNTSVARVDAKGYVTGLSKGSAKITVTAKSATAEFSASCSVTVNELTEITSITPQTTTNNGVYRVVLGETKTFKVKILPETASIKNLEWKNSNNSVISVTKTGLDGNIGYATFKALKSGKSTLTYTSTDGSEKSGSVTVEVLPLVSVLTLSDSVKVITVDSTKERLVPTILPENAGNQVLSWSSSDTSVCQVDNSGLLIPRKIGVCTITAKTTDSSNHSVSCKVRVAALASRVSLNKTSVTLTGDNTVTLKATVTTTTGATYNDVEWVSDNRKVATVNEKGVVTPVGSGTVKIRAIALDGTEKSAVCIVTVKQNVTGVSLPAKKNLAKGQSVTLTPTITPSTATNKKVSWSSSDTSIAYVDQNGKVTARQKVGSCTITVKTADGGFKDSCVINVVIPTTAIRLSKTSVSLKAGVKTSLFATVSPSEATDKTVTWSTSDKNVATVSSTGVVTAVAGGSCTITAKSSGGQKATCTVKVSQAVEAISLSKSKLSLYATQTYALTKTVTPSTATTLTFAWSSSNKAVAVVSSTGVITAVKPGTAVITCAQGAVKATCTVTVTQKIDVTGVSVPASLSMLKGDSSVLKVTVSPSNASNKGLIWRSSNNSVINVTQEGVIKAVGSGKAVITVRTKDGGFSDTCNVTVTQKVKSVKLNYTNLRVAKGTSKKIVATILPSDATNKAIKWESSNPAVATVTSDGLVKAIKTGKTTITATTADGGFVATCNVRVIIGVTGLKLSYTKLTIPRGESRMVTAIITPSNATDQTVKWSTSDKSVATVTAAGQVTAKKTGSCVITAKTADGSYKASCTVRVVQYATSVTLDYTSVSLNVGKTKTISAKLKPYSVTDKTVKFSSSNTKVAKVDKDGKITGLYGGTALIKATSGDGKAYAICKVTVIQPVTSVKFDANSYSVKIGAMQVLTATVKPNNATDSKLTWSSSDKKIATVDSDGVVKGIKKGTVTITASAENGKVKATCKLHVQKAVKGVSLDKVSVTMVSGKTMTLVATVTPQSASNHNVIWSSNNLDVATVNSKGVVTAKGNGYAVITAKTKDGGYKAVCRVIVIEPVKGVSLSKTKMTLDISEAVTLKATIKPKNATNTAVKWSSSNSKVAKVSSSGKVTGLKAGTATITVRSVDGGYTASCKVTVLRKVNDVTLNKQKVTLYLDGTVTLKATITPSNATNKSVRWYSSDTKVVRVDEKGKLTPVKPGKATVSVKTADGGFKASCAVTVERKVNSITLSKSAATLQAGKRITLKATLSPSNATNKTVTWTSSNKSVAAVSSTGIVRAVSGGKAVITAKTSNGLVKKCTVTVLEGVSGVSLKKATLDIYTGKTQKLSYSIIPATATEKGVRWYSSNTSVLKVSSDGTVTALKAGTANVVVKTTDGGYRATCKVNVLQHVTGVKTASSMSLAKGKTAALKVTVLPADATNKALTYTSSNTSVAKISAEGKITALSVGETVITVKTKDMGYTAKLTLTVYEPVTGVTVSPEKKTLFVGETVTVKASISPTDATNKVVTYANSDSAVASVSSKGVVKALKSGKCTITVKTADGGFTGTCEITVLQKATGIKITSAPSSVHAGNTAEFKASVLPADAYNKKVIWTSSDSNVASVDEKGKVTAHKPGGVLITATTEDGGFTESCTLTVTRAVTGVSLSQTEGILNKGETLTLEAVLAPSDATNKDVIWISSDEAVATVKDGVVTATGRGNAIITVKTADGGYTAFFSLEVKQPAESITFETEKIEVVRGESVTVNAVVLPENTNDKSLIWTSSDESTVSVSNGTVYGVKAGTATVTVKACAGTATKDIEVVVIEPAASVKITASADTLWVGETLELTASVLPESATYKTVTWSSEDESVATVDENGVVTAVSQGMIKIKALSYCRKAEAEYTVTVRQQVTEINLSDSEISLTVNGEEATRTCQLSATALPENAYNRNITWESSNTNVVSVDAGGLLKAEGKGEAVVYAKSFDGKVTAECKVTVTKIVTDIALSENSAVIERGKSKSLTAQLTPSDANDTSVTWMSNDTSVAVVDENGNVTAVSAGTCVITAVSSNKTVMANCEVTVEVYAKSVSTEKDFYEIYIGETAEIKANILPEDVTCKNVSFISSDADVAAVDENGVVTGVNDGTVTITVITDDNGTQTTCTVKVCKKETSVNLSAEAITIEAGQTRPVVATVLPADATYKAVTWSSSDEAVAVVDENGNITAKKAGSTVIRATTKNGLTALCNVVITQKPLSVVINPGSVEIGEGETFLLDVTILPSDTTERQLIWTTTDENVVTVANGKLTAKTKGTATVTATSAVDGTVTASVEVKVVKKVTGVVLDKSAVSLYVGENVDITATVAPSDADNKELTFVSSDKAVATVSQGGVITAVGIGTASIIVQTADGGHFATCQVNVKTPIEKISLDKTVLIMNQNSSETLKATLNPQGASAEDVIWESSNPAVVTVADGVVTSVSKAGTVTVSAYSKLDRKVIATCEVTVLQPVKTLGISEENVTVILGESYQLEAIILPGNATNKNVVWDSSDKNAVSVDSTGKITANDVGTAIVSVKTTDGSELTAFCLVTVIK